MTTASPQPQFPTTLERAAQAVVNQLAKRMPDQAAVAWVHSAALVRHAADIGLADTTEVRPALEQVAKTHPALECLLDPAVNPLWDHPLTDDEQQVIADLWGAHALPWDENTRWYSYAVGDLYQALSVEARKGRALCQTPWFISDLLIHVSVDRALEEFGKPLRVIDPSCGTGHVLIETAGHLHRNTDYRFSRDPIASLAAGFDAVHGVDLDPYATAIARYRLVVLAMAYARATSYLYDPAEAVREVPIHVAAADSLLATDEPLLERGRYHVVVANPPYITSKDAAATEAIRARYPEVSHRKFSLALPFHALMMELLVPGGWCAQLTANSFMKREFGKKYVEQWLPQFDAQWVIDTSGAYIPGHGTPTVILVHRNQAPTSDTVSTVLGVRGEPSQPEDPAKGLVWTAIDSAVRSRESAMRFGRGAEVAWREHQQQGQPAVKPAEQPDFVQPTLFDLAEVAA